MNRAQIDLTETALLDALQRLGKEASTPAQYEAMAKLALALVEVSRERRNLR